MNQVNQQLHPNARRWASNNAHVVASNTATIVSGGDTNIAGATILARKVDGDIGGNLNIESVQDTMQSAAHQSSVGAGLNVSAGLGSGAMDSGKREFRIAEILLHRAEPLRYPACSWVFRGTVDRFDRQLCPDERRRASDNVKQFAKRYEETTGTSLTVEQAREILLDTGYRMVDVRNERIAPTDY